MLNEYCMKESMFSWGNLDLAKLPQQHHRCNNNSSNSECQYHEVFHLNIRTKLLIYTIFTKTQAALSFKIPASTVQNTYQVIPLVQMLLTSALLSHFSCFSLSLHEACWSHFLMTPSISFTVAWNNLLDLTASVINIKVKILSLICHDIPYDNCEHWEVLVELQGTAARLCHQNTLIADVNVLAKFQET